MPFATLVPIIAGAVSSIAGGLFNSSSQSSANQANLQVARENNAFNQQMWEKNNAYNSPSAMVQRDLDAGLNPYLQSTQVGNATSEPVSASPVQPMQSTRVGDMFARIPDIANNYFVNYMNQQMTQAKVHKAQADAISATATAKLAEANANKVVSADIPNVQSITENNKKQGVLLQLQTDYDKIRNETASMYLNAQAKATLDETQQRIESLIKGRQLSDEQIKNIVQDTANKVAQEKNINADTVTKWKLLPLLTSKYALENYSNSLSNQLLKKDVDFQNSVTIPDNSIGSRPRS